MKVPKMRNLLVLLIILNINALSKPVKELYLTGGLLHIVDINFKLTFNKYFFGISPGLCPFPEGFSPALQNGIKIPIKNTVDLIFFEEIGYIISLGKRTCECPPNVCNGWVRDNIFWLNTSIGIQNIPRRRLVFGGTIGLAGLFVHSLGDHYTELNWERFLPTFSLYIGISFK